jgi:hypothetical protein
MRRTVWGAVAASVALAGAVTAAPAAQATAAPAQRPTAAPWAAVIAMARHAVYGITVGDADWWGWVWTGTGFEEQPPDGALLDVSAGHVVTRPWGSTFVRWSKLGILLPGSTTPLTGTTMYKLGDTYLWTHDDTVIYNTDQGAGYATGALTLGNWQTLTVGEPLLVLGNRMGTWSQTGEAQASFCTYSGLYATTITDDAAFPGRRPMLALWCPQAGPTHGDSGSPVITPVGQVVGVFLSGSPHWGYAMPLNPQDGLPVDRSPVQTITRAVW